MKNSGILLIGFSLLTLALIIALSKITEAIFVIGAVQVVHHITPIIVYFLIVLVFISGIFSMFRNKK